MWRQKKTPDSRSLAKMLMDNSRFSEARTGANGITVYVDDGTFFISTYVGLSIFVNRREPRYEQLLEIIEDTLKQEGIPYEKDDWDLPDKSVRHTRLALKI
jgi:hypothetical protein